MPFFIKQPHPCPQCQRPLRRIAVEVDYYRGVCMPSAFWSMIYWCDHCRMEQYPAYDPKRHALVE